MNNNQWRGIVVDELREHTGPLAPILVDDVIAESRIAPGAADRDSITHFLRQLRPELPSCIDASRFILDLNRRLVVEQNREVKTT